MKIKSLILSAFIGAICGLSAFGQDVVTNAPADMPKRDNAWYSRAIGFKQGVADAKTVSVAIYPSYAQGLKVNGVSKPWGFGAAALYPVTDHTFTGFRIDYAAGDFLAGQAAVGVNADIQIGKFNFRTFIITSVLLPIQGSGNDNFKPGNATGGGISAILFEKDFTSGSATIHLAYEGERWQVPGSVLDGVFMQHIALMGTWKF